VADEDAFCKKSSLIMQMTNMGVIKHMRTFEQKRTPFFLLINNCRLCITPSVIRATLLCNNNDCPGQNDQSTVVFWMFHLVFFIFKKNLLMTQPFKFVYTPFILYIKPRCTGIEI